MSIINKIKIDTNEYDIGADYSNITSTPDLSHFITKDVNDLTYYELKTATGNSIAMSIDSSTYVLTISLKNSAGTILNTQTVDLPLESVVVSGSYDSTNKKIILTLQSGSTIDIPVGDLVSGLQAEITSENKLSSDLVDDTNNTNKFVSTSEKSTWNAKYDLPSGGIPSTDLSSAVQTSLGKADTAIQDISGKQDTLVSGTNIKTINNNSVLGSGNITVENNGLHILSTTEGTSQNPLILDELEVGLYTFANDSDLRSVYLKGTVEDTTSTLFYLSQGSFPFEIVKKYSEASNNDLLVIDAFKYGAFSGSSEVISRQVRRDTSSSSGVRVGSNSASKYWTVSFTNSEQTITTKKTFNVLPESSVVPTTANQLTNKSYVDSKSIQYSTMPTADSTIVGKIVQYIGTTDSTYTNGYFYIGTTDGESTPTYTRENINVQASSGGNSHIGGYIIRNTDSSDHIKTILQAIYDEYITNNNFVGIIYTEGTSVTNFKIYTGVNFKTSSNTWLGIDFGGYIVSSGKAKSGNFQNMITATLSNGVISSYTISSGGESTQELLTSFSSTNIYGTFNFGTYLPTATASPTTNDQLANKKYVDDSIASAITTTLGGNY